MRLKHIHLAGFKSFVDPVTIPTQAMLTGVVGPNGCGKSNVIDAVRWVLGESKARELRGESLQDVIFNGSATRRPAARAMVELLFDNGDGRAPGQWSRYAEISVKRVLTRGGESSYFINDVHVRKRDMADLFLGTGLGGDAYAIVEQGMISRLIEARPEELRGYLEEAAGVSKYRERRRETESRLRDARENLARVDDLRAELARQLEKLTVQAEVARRYYALESERQLKTRWLAYTRRNEARARQAELARELEQAHTAIEAQKGEQRRLEAELERARVDHFDASERMNQAQAGYYAAGGEVARLEQELRHRHDTRQRLTAERQAALQRQEALAREITGLQAEIAAVEDERSQAHTQAQELAARAVEVGEGLPAAEEQWRAAQAAVAALQAEVSQLEQTVRLEQAHQGHADRLIEQLKARELRLLQEREGLAALDESHLERLQAELEEGEARVQTLDEYLQAARAELPQLEAAVRQARAALSEVERQLHRLEAQKAALEKLQQAVRQAEHAGEAWLQRLGLASVPRLWQAITVEPGWETAVEAALGEALAALTVEAAVQWLAEPPQTRFELALPAVEGQAPPLELALSDPRLRPLTELVHSDDPVVARFLADRLALAWAAEDLTVALEGRAGLPAGGFIATREGHRVGRASLVLNAPDKGHHGLLARSREIERIGQELTLERARGEALVQALAEAEDAWTEGRRRTEALQRQLAEAQAVAHRRQMELVRLQETAQRVSERRGRIQAELDELYAQLDAESEAYNTAAEREREAQARLEDTRARLQQARLRRQEAEQRLQGLREAHRRAEREAQEGGYRVRALEDRHRALAERLAQAERQQLELALQLDRLQTALGETEDAPLRAQLQQALEQRQSAETALIAARERLEACTAAVQSLETARLTAERALEPLTARVQQLQLKLQEAQLQEARHAEALQGVDEAELLGQARAAGIEGRAESWLRAELTRLEADIAALGPVNMAALDELQAAEARKGYLDAQAEDLGTATATLEEAIRRIDAESRARLKETFERVGTEFRHLFAELFGGGNADLILTGEEILDAGLVVMAQPPGKKNSSIHLLSGGEKALTALALVFAFFRLNPAPFCLLDEVDAPLDDANTERFCALVRRMAQQTQFIFITHNRLTMELAEHLVGVTMPEPGVSRCVAVDVEGALRMAEAA
ncbi:MAG: chromosome segregation protein SMC [Thiobacillaceae bacterium]|nr:chromosome segregation protein SMC [Thiobacillaceae bacterium]